MRVMKMLVFPMAVAQTPEVGQPPGVGMTALIRTNFCFPDLEPEWIK